MTARLITFLLIALSWPTLFAQEKPITLKDLFVDHTLSPTGFRSVTWHAKSNGLNFMDFDTLLKARVLKQENIDGSKTQTILSSANLISPADPETTLKINNYQWSKSGNMLLLTTSLNQVWRRSKTARYYVYTPATKKLQSVFDGQITNVHFSPDERQIGFVYKNNIYMKSLKSGKLTQLTHDGSKMIINGKFDWVYEEEFSVTDGWKWAPDGKTIVFWRLDQSNEPEFSWTEFNELHGKVKTIRYPKAGDPNALVKIGLYDLQNGKTRWLDLGKESDIYIPRIYWRPDGQALYVEKMNRRQNKMDFLSYNMENLKPKTVLTETDPAWVEVFDNFYFLPDGKNFIWTSERDGYNHIYLYDRSGKTFDQLTTGKWVVQKVYGSDGQKIYFAANKGTVLEQHIFSVNIHTKELTKLTTHAGWHSARFSPNFKYFIDSWSNSATPYRATLRDRSGLEVRSIYKSSIKNIDDYQLSRPGFLNFTTSDGEKLYGQLTKPLDFDPNKKYPVLLYCYGGPGVQVVRNAWGGPRAFWHSMLAQKGYLVFSVDNRGSNGRGKKFKNFAKGDLGKWPLHDQIQGAKYLASLPYVDKTRIGIWGWSFGGYLTLMSMTKGSGYFKTGISVAPVSDFRLYDTIYTERYMDIPANNHAGYDSTSVLSYVDKYRKGLLVVHGSSDDNVHVQNTMQFINKMETANKQFRLMIYPGKNHGLPGRHYHLYTMMTNFILNNL